MDQPLVSVILPTYNRPALLQQALQSVLNQTYAHFEVIVVNDAGIDVSHIVHAFHDKRIKYILHEKNKGLPAARNTAIQQAIGKYIAYLDDDDLFLPEHLSVFVEHFQKNKAKVAYSDAIEIERIDSSIIQKGIRALEIDANTLLVKNKLPPVCIMHERVCLDIAGVFDETLKRYEDWDLYIRLSQKFHFSHINTPTAQYTVAATHNQMVTTWFAYFLNDMLIIHRRYFEIAKHLPDVMIEQIEERETVRRRTFYDLEKITDDQLKKMHPEIILRQVAKNSLYHTLDDVRGARGLCGFLTNRLPDNAGLWLLLAQLSRFLGELQVAKNAIQKAIAVEESLDVLCEYIHICQELKDVSEAKRGLDYLKEHYYNYELMLKKSLEW